MLPDATGLRFIMQNLLQMSCLKLSSLIFGNRFSPGMYRWRQRIVFLWRRFFQIIIPTVNGRASYGRVLLCCLPGWGWSDCWQGSIFLPILLLGMYLALPAGI